MKSVWRQRVGIFLLFNVCVAAAWGQSMGSITGAARDASGAVLPGARVRLTNLQTGTVYRSRTNQAGIYLFGALNAGRYTLSVTAHGFKRYVASGIVLNAGETIRADARLTVGAVTSTVNVNAASVGRVHLETATLANTVTGKQVTQLELNGRNFAQLITLVPGVVNSGNGYGVPATEAHVGVAGNVNYSVNGGRQEYNNWEIDGSNVEDNGSNGTLNVYPSVDAISQVRIMTSNYGAQYGRDAAGAVLVQTKGGGNQWHGDAYEFVRNTDLNANTFFNNAAGQPRSSYHKNDYGFTIGGPVVKNKTFIFWSEEWRKSVQPTSFNTQVPSTQELQGNFNDVCPAAGTGVTPNATNSATGNSFATDYPACPEVAGTVGTPQAAFYPGNAVPIDPNAKVLLGLIPAPNNGSGANSFYIASPSEPTNWREELFRIDQNLGANTHLYYQFIHDSWNTVSVPTLWGNFGNFPVPATQFGGPGVAMVAHLTQTLAPNLINEFVAGYTTDHISLNDTGPIQRTAGFSMPGYYQNGYDGGILPSISVSSNASPVSFGVDTGDEPWNNSNPTYNFRDQVNQVLGSHNLYYGGELTASQKNEMGGQEPQGQLTFCGGCWSGSTNNGLADMFVGAINNYSQNLSRPKYYDRYKTADLFLQDDWHVQSNLTLDLGMQLDLLGTYYNANQLDSNFVPGAYSAAAFPGFNQAAGDGSINGTSLFLNGMVRCGVGNTPPGCANGHLMNWAPRLGFSWDPFGHGTTAVRGGYGIFYEHTNGNEIIDQLRNSIPPAVQSVSINNISGYGNVASGSAGEIFPQSPGMIPAQQIWPYVQQWNLDVQHQFSHNFIATLAYVGSKGTHLSDTRDFNQPVPLPLSQNPFAPGQPLTSADCTAYSNNGTLANGAAVGAMAGQYLSSACGLSAAGSNPYRPYLGYGSISIVEMQANSNYNALQATMRRTMGNLNLEAAYTWSHSLDNASDRYDAPYVNSYNLAMAYASSAFDIRQNLSLNWVYQLPFFARNTWLGGWEWSGIMTLETGPPFSVTNGSGNSASLGLGRSGQLGTPPDQVSNPGVNVSNAPATVAAGPLFYNPAAFTLNRGLTWGDVGRNTLRSPGFSNFNMGLFKNFHITERQNIQLRGEAFNVFNQVQWDPLSGSISCFDPSTFNAGGSACASANSTLFRPTGTHLGRIVQLALKWSF